MLSRRCAWFLLASTLVALGAGCKASDRADQDSRPLPAPEPPASQSPGAALPRDDATPAPRKRASDDDAPDSAGKTKRPAAAAPVAKGEGTTPTAPDNTGGSAAATTTTGGGPGSVLGVPSAPPFAAPSAACLSRCQAAMQGCLSTPVDGGVPGFSNLELCKKAFEACQSACSKP